jgi:hypothetical protein
MLTLEMVHAKRPPVEPGMTASMRFAMALLVCACGAQEPLPLLPGMSEPRVEHAASPTSDAGAVARWARAGEAATYPHVSRVSFPSHGHFEGRWIADLIASGGAAKAYAELGPRTRLAQGSVIIEQLREPGTLARGPWFVMEKREPGYFSAGGDFSYVVVSARGEVEDEGKLARCARCHAEGIGDSLFGVPADGR